MYVCTYGRCVHWERTRYVHVDLGSDSTKAARILFPLHSLFIFISFAHPLSHLSPPHSLKLVSPLLLNPSSLPSRSLSSLLISRPSDTPYTPSLPSPSRPSPCSPYLFPSLSSFSSPLLFPLLPFLSTSLSILKVELLGTCRFSFSIILFLLSLFLSFSLIFFNRTHPCSPTG
jgi:hypothetical protein